MKKALLGTTALVAGGLFASAAVAADLIPAPAPEPVEEGFTLNVSGFMTAYFLFRSNDEYGTDHDVTPTQISLSSEIYFDAEQTLANGHTIKAHIELEAENNGSNNWIDEAWLSLSGSWGEFRIGGEDGALNLIDISQPTAGIYGDADGASFAAITAGNAPQGTFSGVTSDDNKIVYFTPRMSGVQLAASFTPDTTGNGPAFAGGGAIPDDSGSDYTNVWDIAVNVQHTWGEYKLTVAGGYEAGDAESGNGNGDVDIWNAGVVIQNSRGSLGFKYSARDNNAVGATVDEATGWAAQGTIKLSGDTTLGGGYFKGVADLTGSVADDEFSRFYIGIDNAYAAGVTIGAFVAFEDFDAAAGSASDKDGVVGGAGMTVKF